MKKENWDCGPPGHFKFDSNFKVTFIVSESEFVFPYSSILIDFGQSCAQFIYKNNHFHGCLGLVLSIFYIKKQHFS